MNGSLIHAAFDPTAHVLFSAGSVATGFLLERGWLAATLRRVAVNFRRSAARSAHRIGVPPGVHSLGIAEH
jgi:hypothetical protein